MKPVFAAAKADAAKRVVYAEGEDERVLRAAQVVVDERPRAPDAGRPAGSDRARASSASACGSKRDADFDLVDPEQRPALPRILDGIPPLAERSGVSPEIREARDAPALTLIGAMLMHMRRGRRACCAARSGATTRTCDYVDQRHRAGGPGVKHYAAMNMLLLPQPHGVHLRHLRQLRSHRGADRRDDGARGRGDPALRHHAQGRAAVALELRRRRHADRASRCAARSR